MQIKPILPFNLSGWSLLKYSHMINLHRLFHTFLDILFEITQKKFKHDFQANSISHINVSNKYSR